MANLVAFSFIMRMEIFLFLQKMCFLSIPLFVSPKKYEKYICHYLIVIQGILLNVIILFFHSMSLSIYVLVSLYIDLSG